MSSILSSNNLTFLNNSGKIIVESTAMNPNILNHSSEDYSIRPGIQNTFNTRVYIDYLGQIYLTGIYNSSFDVNVPNLTGSESTFSLPSTSSTDYNFLIKYTKQGIVMGSVIIGTTNSYGSTITFGPNCLYWTGNYKSSTTIDVKELNSDNNVYFSIQEPQSSLYFNTFSIQYDYEGIPIKYISLDNDNDTITTSTFINGDDFYILGYYLGNFTPSNFDTNGSKLDIDGIIEATVVNGFIVKYTGNFYNGISVLEATEAVNGNCVPNSATCSDTKLFIGGYYYGLVNCYSFISSLTNDTDYLSIDSDENRMFTLCYDLNSGEIELYINLDSTSLCSNVLYTNNNLYVYGIYNGSSLVYDFGGQTVTSTSLLSPSGSYNPFVLKYNHDLKFNSLLTIPSNTSSRNTMAISGPNSIFLLGQYTSSDSVNLYNFYTGSTVPSSSSTLPSASVSNQFILEYDFYGNLLQYGNNRVTSSSLSVDNYGLLYNTAVYNGPVVYTNFSGLESYTFGPSSFTGSLLVSIDSEDSLGFKNGSILRSIAEPVEDNEISNKKYVDGQFEYIKNQNSVLDTSSSIISVLEPWDVYRNKVIEPIINNSIVACSTCDSQGTTYIVSYCNSASFLNLNNKDGSFFNKLNVSDNVVFTLMCKYNSNGILLGNTILRGTYPSEVHVDKEDNVYLSGYSDYGLLYPISIYNIDFGTSSSVETIQGGSIYFIVKWSSEGYYVDNVSQFSNYDIKDLNNFVSNSFTISKDGSTMYQTISNSLNTLNNFISLENAGYYNTSIFSNIDYPLQTIVSASVRYLNSFISIYGDTMAIGIPQDSSGVGATWIYVRGTDGIWTQQGSKLVGSSSSTISLQGQGVSLYKDTLAVGGYNTTSGIPSLWMFQRIGTVWTQIGSKLAPSDAVGGSIVTWQTVSVSIYDNTLALSSPYDNNNRGAAWLYKKNTSGEWSQATSKIISPTPITRGYFSTVSLGRNTLSVGEGGNFSPGYKGKIFIYDVNGTSVSLAFTGSSTDAVGLEHEGNFTSISEDGNYVLTGLLGYNSIGCSIVYYKNSSGQWSQQTPPLVGTGYTGNPTQGYSGCITKDSSCFITYAPGDDSTQGANWIFTRSGTVWTQYGSKLVSPGVDGAGRPYCCVDKNYAAFTNSDSTTSTGSVSVYDLNRSGLIKYKNGLVEGFSPIIGAKLTSTIVDGQDNVYCTTYTSGSTFSLYNIRNSEETGYSMKETSGGTSVIKWTSDGLYEANSFIKGSYATKLVTDKQNNLYCTGLYSSNEQVPVYDLMHLQYPNKESKLIGTGGTSAQGQGYSISLSSDGSTLAVGGPADNTDIGATWIFTRSGTTWSQQGSKLIGTGGTGSSQQGYSVSLSSDGSTLAVGGYGDNTNVGATWIFTRSGTTWSQQGSKLIGTGGTGSSQQGQSVSLSSDGSTLAVGGYTDNTNVGATWIFTRSGTTWSQQGSKLIGTGGTGSSQQGQSVSLSSDGSILAVGSYGDNTNVGATWIFTRSGTIWTQQGSKLVGTGGTGTQLQGASVSLSSDGSILAVSGYGDNSNVGATWIFTRSGTVWTQQGSKLVGTGGTGIQRQGQSVSLTSDGSILAVGGHSDNSSVGATWIFTRSGTVWTQYGSKLVGTGGTGTPGQGYSVSFSSSGSILAVGGYFDNSQVGATWIFYPFSTYTQQLGLYLPESYGLGSTYNQIGSKLIGTGGTGTQWQGSSVSISSDGSTMAVGGLNDNSDIGAIWIYTRSGTIWTQQGSKLVGTGGTGTTIQGSSVSLSSDGNTLAVGGYGDNSNVGAVWIFTRSGTVWSQQGSKLVGTGGTGSQYQGISISLSSDGSTLAVGGYGDNSNIGAVWIYTRSGTIWTQQGSKLVGTGGTGTQQQGSSISLSSNGSTLAVGGYGDNSLIGAVWIYTRSGTVWTQQGSKLVGTGGTNEQYQGLSVSLSSDGSILSSGGGGDNFGVGATWLFTRSGTIWSQQGSKLVGTGDTSASQQGISVSLSSNGSVLAVGGNLASEGIGSVWIFTRNINGDFIQQGSKLVGTGGTSTQQQGYSVSLSSDGSILAIGGPDDNSDVGAVWVFSNRISSTSSFVTKWSSNGTAQNVLSIPSSFKNSASVDNFNNFYLSNVYTSHQNIPIQNFRNTNNESYSQYSLEGNINNNTWTTTGSMNIGRQRHCINLLNSGKVLIAGGQTANSSASATASTEIYNPDTGIWTTIGSLSIARYNASSVNLKNGKILVAGGTSTSGNVSLSNCDLFDPSTESWKTTTSMLMTRSSFSLICLNNGLVLASGSATNGLTSVAELYNPFTETWTTTGSTIVSHGEPVGTLLPSNKVLLVSGNNTPICELYDPNSGTWTLTDSLPVSTRSYQYTSVPDSFLVYGGIGGSSNGMFSYEYNSGLWKTSLLAPVAASVYEGKMTMLPNGNVLLYGGSTGGTISSSTYLYEPLTNTWTSSTQINKKLFGSVLLKNGKILVTGGSNGSEPYESSCLLYCPQDYTLSLIKFDNTGQVQGLSSVHNICVYNNFANNTVSFDDNNNINLLSNMGSINNFYNYNQTGTTLLTIDNLNENTIIPVSTNLTKWFKNEKLSQEPYKEQFIVKLPDTDDTNDTIKNIVLNSDNYDCAIETSSRTIPITKNTTLYWSSEENKWL